jgi:eukaryotic-like serine/threonine-protein kinase
MPWQSGGSVTQDQGQAAAAPQQRLLATRYVMLGEIGRGGMGIVWLAEDRMIGRRVAIKELHLPEGVPPGERGVFEERVLREARTAGRLNDPAVVTVYDVLQEAGNTYIVMELIQAPTLADLVKRSGPLPSDAVTALAGQLLSALEAAHAAGIVHRDVKPSNVMVLPNGRVKLTDFGIAQSLDDPRLTTSGVLIGSPTYMSPERIQGGEADAASDLWSLGQVLFYAVEGYSPFERSSTAATMHAIMTEVPYLTRCQGPLASVIMGLLINTPQARLNAAQVRGLLSQAVPGPSTGPQGVYPSTALYPQPPRDATRVAPPRKGRLRLVLGIVLAAVLVFLAFLAGVAAGRKPVNAADPAKGQTLVWGDGGDVPEYEVSLGACAASPLTTGRSYPSASDCKEPHDFQTFGVHDTVNSSSKVDYPGKEAMSQFGEAWCGMLFASNLITGDRGKLSYVTLVPSADAWDDTAHGGRSIICAAQSRDGKQLDDSVVSDR